MSRAYGAGSFLGSPYQKVEYLIGRENGTTRAGLVSSPAGFHGTWVHPNPGQPVELNVICVGAGGGMASSNNGGNGTDGTKTIFGVLTANGGGGALTTAGGSGSLSGGYSNSNFSEMSIGMPFGFGTSVIITSNSSVTTYHGGTGYVVTSASYTVTGNIDYIIGRGGRCGMTGSGGNDSPDGGIILQYNSTN